MADDAAPAGSGPLPPVLLLHGWAGSYRSTWTRTGWDRELAARGRRVIEVDLPGHGPRGGPHDPAHYTDVTALVERQLPADGPVDVVGYSLGGKIALQLAFRRPGRIRRAVVAGLGGNLFARENGAPVVEALRNGLGPATAPVVRELATYAFQSANDLEALAACLLRPATPMTPAEVAALSLPVLLAVGDQDTFIGAVEPLAERLPTSRLELLRGVDHLATPFSSELQAAALAFLGLPDPPEQGDRVPPPSSQTFNGKHEKGMHHG